MVTFKQLAGLQVRPDVTRELPLTDLEGVPVLLVSPAAQENPAYYSAIVKRSRAIAKKTPNMSVEQVLAAGVESDKAIYPGTVIRGWRGFVDEEGQDIPFSIDSCRELLQILPAWVFNKVRAFVQNPQNFTDAAILSDVDDDITEGVVGDDAKKS